MSELKVNSIVDASSGNTVQINGQTPSESNMQGRNRIINGDMRIDQRATSVSAHSGGGYTTLDRWNLFQNLGAINIAQSSTAPTGFSNSMQFTVSTAASQTSSATSVVTPNQSIEGFNTSDLMWGTANAKSITVSVWVYSNLIGQYAIWIRNGAADRYYATPFTITTANTWQQVTATIAGDTSGTWVGATNGIGLTIGICLAAGSSRVGAGNTWSGSTYYGVTGQVDWQATASNTFFFTGVQLEAGAVATPFERRPFGAELALCQRYYYKIKAIGAADFFGSGLAYGAAAGRITAPFKVSMRTSPTALEQTGTASDFRLNNATAAGLNCTAVPVFVSASTEVACVDFSVASGLTAGNATLVLANAGSNAFLAWSAEL